jgi:hypothetical protein
MVPIYLLMPGYALRDPYESSLHIRNTHIVHVHISQILSLHRLM